jgi:hypothetical protein
MTEYMYAFKRHRKAELIAKICADKKMTKREANAMTLEKLCELTDEPYVPMRVLPKPSHRRPLPVRKWVVPRENKVFIVMSKPFEKVYGEWEEKYDKDDMDIFYDNIRREYNHYPKCPKVKWLKKFLSRETKRVIVFVSPMKWNAVKDQFADVQHNVIHSLQTKVGKKALSSFEDGEVKLLVVVQSRPQYEEFPDCTWIHFEPNFTHSRYASEHYYLHTVKSAEEKWVTDSEAVPENHLMSLDLYKMFHNEDSDSE